MEEANTTHILRTRPLLVERFTMVAVLGEGAAGAVYRVKDHQRQDQEVALKILLNNSAFDENTLDRFMRELQICRTIKHPNVVEAYDLIHLGDTIAFTMEYVPGSDLGHVFRKRRLTYVEVEDYFTKILSGLEALHAEQVVHRDMKLENVLIGEAGVVKISDLGLMKWGEFESMTKTGILLGTAQYMPPEYVRESVYDQRGDIYAVGLMLYEVLTGKRRLIEKSGNEALEYLIRTKFEIPRITLTGLPRKYLEILDAATAADPNERYQTAAEMREALSTLPLPSDDEMKKSVYRAPETQRFCEKSALSQALESSPARSGNILRYLMLVMTFCVLLLALPYLFKIFESHTQLEVGHYEGSLELYGGTGFRKAMQLDVRPEGLQFFSTYDYCKKGDVELSTGEIQCGRKGLRMKIEKHTDKSISGTIVDLVLREQHSFTVTKKR